MKKYVKTAFCTLSLFAVCGAFASCGEKTVGGETDLALRLNTKYIAKNSVNLVYDESIMKNAEKFTRYTNEYFIFYANGKGEYSCRIISKENEMVITDYTISFLYDFVGDEVVCTYDGITYGKDNTTINKKDSFFATFQYSENILLAGSVYYAEDYARMLPKLNEKNVFYKKP